MKKGTKLFLCHTELDRRSRLFWNPCLQGWPPHQGPDLPGSECGLHQARPAAGRCAPARRSPSGPGTQGPTEEPTTLPAAPE